MHYPTLVVLDTKPENLESAVAEALYGYQDREWDWYQIGGRWAHTFAHNVKKVASLTDADVAKFFAIVPSGYGWYAREHFEPWRPNGECFVPAELPPLAWLREQFPDGVAVCVDCHN